MRAVFTQFPPDQGFGAGNAASTSSRRIAAQFLTSPRELEKATAVVSVCKADYTRKHWTNITSFLKCEQVERIWWKRPGSPQPRTPLAAVSYCMRVFRDYWVAGLPVGGARSLQTGIFNRVWRQKLAESLTQEARRSADFPDCHCQTLYWALKIACCRKGRRMKGP